MMDAGCRFCRITRREWIGSGSRFSLREPQAVAKTLGGSRISNPLFYMAIDFPSANRRRHDLTRWQRFAQIGGFFQPNHQLAATVCFSRINLREWIENRFRFVVDPPLHVFLPD